MTRNNRSIPLKLSQASFQLIGEYLLGVGGGGRDGVDWGGFEGRLKERRGVGEIGRRVVWTKIWMGEGGGGRGAGGEVKVDWM
jgi:hypothetical protein